MATNNFSPELQAKMKQATEQLSKLAEQMTSGVGGAMATVSEVTKLGRAGLEADLKDENASKEKKEAAKKGLEELEKAENSFKDIIEQQKKANSNLADVFKKAGM